MIFDHPVPAARTPLRSQQIGVSRLILSIAPVLAVSTKLFVAREATVPIFAIVGLPPMHAIDAAAAAPIPPCPNEVASHLADNRALRQPPGRAPAENAKPMGGETE
jgi:hypothetical protein